MSSSDTVNPVEFSLYDKKEESVHPNEMMKWKDVKLKKGGNEEMDLIWHAPNHKALNQAQGW